MIEALLILWSGLAWRMRGVYGWPFTLLWAWPFLAWLGHPADGWTIAGLLLSHAGETVGWKPKACRGGDWWECTWRGALIWGLGALCVPLSTWLHSRFGEPSWPRNNWHHFFLGHARLPFNWYYAWNEFYFGVLFACLFLSVSAILEWARSAG